MLDALTYSILVFTTVTGHVTAAAMPREMPPDIKACTGESCPCFCPGPRGLKLYIASLMNSSAKKCTPTPTAKRATVGDVPLQRPLKTRVVVQHSICEQVTPYKQPLITVPAAS